VLIANSIAWLLVHVRVQLSWCKGSLDSYVLPLKSANSGRSSGALLLEASLSLLPIMVEGMLVGCGLGRACVARFVSQSVGLVGGLGI
jgi:hypothetical protein